MDIRCSFIELLFLQTIDGFINFGSFRLLPLSITQYLQFVFILSIIFPIQEELLYRGLLILIPSQRIKYLMLFISSLLFAFIHAEPTFQFFLGLGLGILAIRFNNILVPIFAHSLWNLFNSLFNFLLRQYGFTTQDI
ncbi:CPBP family intramembrane glutamic endopeptidase [Aquibacillus koreensis]|uniref:CPBP family intramembrane glutamic endopeptidase n=1 Tax=Aquibacillus koreensis TaxID=279446 RepID=UPI00389960A3